MDPTPAPTPAPTPTPTPAEQTSLAAVKDAVERYNTSATKLNAGLATFMSANDVCDQHGTMFCRACYDRSSATRREQNKINQINAAVSAINKHCFVQYPVQEHVDARRIDEADVIKNMVSAIPAVEEVTDKEAMWLKFFGETYRDYERCHGDDAG